LRSQESKVPHLAAVAIGDGLVRVDAVADTGCGVCVAHCPQAAIALVRDLTRGEPLEIQQLVARAADSAQD